MTPTMAMTNSLEGSRKLVNTCLKNARSLKRSTHNERAGTFYSYKIPSNSYFSKIPLPIKALFESIKKAFCKSPTTYC